MDILLEQVKRIPYFQDLEPRILERIRSAMFEVQAGKGKLFFSEGEPAEAMYGVRSGQVKIFKLSPDGREQVLRIVGPGECVNEVPIFDGGPNPANAQALESARLWGIRRTDM